MSDIDKLIDEVKEQCTLGQSIEPSDVNYLLIHIREQEAEYEFAKNYLTAAVEMNVKENFWQKIELGNFEQTHKIAKNVISDLREENKEQAKEIERLKTLAGRRFPVQKGSSVLWSMVKPHEAQMIENHSQDMEQLAFRRGLDPIELLAVLDDRRHNLWGRPYEEVLKEAQAELQQRMIEYEKCLKYPMSALKKEIEQLKLELEEAE